MGYDLFAKPMHDRLMELQEKHGDAEDVPEENVRELQLMARGGYHRLSIWGMAMMRRFLVEVEIPEEIREKFGRNDGDYVTPYECELIAASLLEFIAWDVDSANVVTPRLDYERDTYAARRVLAAIGKGDLPTDWEIALTARMPQVNAGPITIEEVMAEIGGSAEPIGTIRAEADVDDPEEWRQYAPDMNKPIPGQISDDPAVAQEQLSQTVKWTIEIGQFAQFVLNAIEQDGFYVR